MKMQEQEKSLRISKKKNRLLVQGRTRTGTPLLMGEAI